MVWGPSPGRVNHVRTCCSLSCFGLYCTRWFCWQKHQKQSTAFSLGHEAGVHSSTIFKSQFQKLRYSMLYVFVLIRQIDTRPIPCVLHCMPKNLLFAKWPLRRWRSCRWLKNDFTRVAWLCLVWGIRLCYLWHAVHTALREVCWNLTTI